MIQATATTDDNKIEIKFDATQWFEQASNQDLINVKNVNFCGDHACDEIAVFMSCFIPMDNLFDHITMGNGFSVTVDANQAQNWLDNNRPNLNSEPEINNINYSQDTADAQIAWTEYVKQSDKDGLTPQDCKLFVAGFNAGRYCFFNRKALNDKTN